ncbi:MAG: hypothetical protein ACM3XM_09350 [Mycobacterium leprae]
MKKPIAWFISLLLVLGVVGSLGPSPVQADTRYDTKFVCADNYDSRWWCRPPDHIRVKRMATGKVETIPFDSWLMNTLPNEINCSTYAKAVVQANTVALRMYGWARHLAMAHNSPSNDKAVRAYDVTDDSSDGALYKPNTWGTACNEVIRNTAGVMMVRDYFGSAHGTIFESGWRRGAYEPVTNAMLGSDLMQQQNAQYEVYWGRWEVRDDALNYFYGSFHIHRY